MRRLEQSILSGQNLASNFLAHTYTADAEREVYARLFLSGLIITGSSSLRAWMEIQNQGSGSSHVGVPVTEPTMLTGTTINAVFFSTIPEPVYPGDVVKIYCKGTVVDTSIYVRTEVYENDGLRPAVADREIALTALGEVSLSTGTMSSINDPLVNAVPGTYLAGTAGAALGRIGSGQISTTSVVAQNGDTETYRGDDYLDADARRIEWTDVSANWPTLTAATILVIIGGDISFAGSVITATGASKKVGVELTSTQTLTIPQGKLEFVVRATLSSGHVVTLVEGTWTSKRQLVVGS